MTLPQQYFRAGVGALIVHRDGHVLALERADHPGAWQLPQGGLDRSEEPLDGVYREIGEETGTRKQRAPRRPAAARCTTGFSSA